MMNKIYNMISIVAFIGVVAIRSYEIPSIDQRLSVLDKEYKSLVMHNTLDQLDR